MQTGRTHRLRHFRQTLYRLCQSRAIDQGRTGDDPTPKPFTLCCCLLRELAEGRDDVGPKPREIAQAQPLDWAFAGARSGLS